ncbi:MAG: hypothetical protein QMC36_04660 [Patescibacteria group bacterium]
MTSADTAARQLKIVDRICVFVAVAAVVIVIAMVLTNDGQIRQWLWGGILALAIVVGSLHMCALGDGLKRYAMPGMPLPPPRPKPRGEIDQTQKGDHV